MLTLSVLCHANIANLLLLVCVAKFLNTYLFVFFDHAKKEILYTN